MGWKMPKTNIRLRLALCRVRERCRKSDILRCSWLNIWVIFMPDRFSER